MKHNTKANMASWSLIAAMMVACLMAGLGMNFAIGPASSVAPLIVLTLLWIALVIGERTDRPRLALGATAFLQMTLFTIIGVVLAYILAARAGPLWDDPFTAADAFIGLNWPAIFRVADSMPIALWAGGIAYHSLTLQMIVCIVVLSITDQREALQLAVLAAVVSGFLTIAISGLMPAMGNVFDPINYRHLWPSVAWMEQDLISGLRSGSNRILDLSHLMGIVTFPSYHATLPVILAWAQRDVRRWRVIAPLWGGVTILATPLFGGHYGIDVIAGLMLAILGIATARLVAMNNSPTPLFSRLRGQRHRVGRT